MAIQGPPSILTLVLQSADGLHLGNIHFAKIQTTLQMCTMPIEVLEKWAEGGSFNPEDMAEGDYSHTTAILILFESKCRGYSTGKHKRWAHCSMTQGASGPHMHYYEAHQVCSFLDESRRAIL